MNAADLRSNLTDLFNGVLDLFYPPHCILCEAIGEDAICPRCLSTLITPVPQPFCLRCGQIQPRSECLKCIDYPQGLIRCRAVGIYDGELARAIHLLKYRDRPMLAGPLGALMADYLRIRAEAINNLQFDSIVPVPLHKLRELKRGYNQSARLAMSIGDRLGIVVRSNLLHRTKNTQPQVGQLRDRRLKNLEGAFRVTPGQCYGRTFLLVDDVTTTGSTMSQCAKALLEAGASQVYGITLALG